MRPGISSILIFALAASCAVPTQATAFSFTQPGGTMGQPLGTAPPAGLYFTNLANWGLATNTALDHTTELGYVVPGFLWSSGYKILGASYSALVIATFEDTGTSRASYLRGVFNPAIVPISLSWNLGNDFYVSVQETTYLPLNTEVAQPGAGFEQAVSFSYTGHDWVISANNIFGVTTTGAGGLKEPDYYNIDATLAHNFGPWQVGVVAYGSFDLETTLINASLGRGKAVGVGGLLGYTFSNNIALVFMADHQVLTEGATEYLKDDTRVWTSISIPVWTPPAPAPKPVTAKY
jgi:hypothetical protein